MLEIIALVLSLLPALPFPADGAAACVRIVDRGAAREGCGVIVGRRGPFLYVLTAGHVASRSERLEVHVPAAAGAPAVVLREADVLIVAAAQDIALLRVAAGSARVTPLPLAGGPAAMAAFDARSIGNGEARAEHVLGRKLLRRRDGTTVFAWECRDAPEAGRSGAPLVDGRGRVIGICSGAQAGRGYYCHQDEIAAVLRKGQHGWLLEAAGEKADVSQKP